MIRKNIIARLIDDGSLFLYQDYRHGTYNRGASTKYVADNSGGEWEMIVSNATVEQYTGAQFDSTDYGYTNDTDSDFPYSDVTYVVFQSPLAMGEQEGYPHSKTVAEKKISAGVWQMRIEQIAKVDADDQYMVFTAGDSRYYPSTCADSKGEKYFAFHAENSGTTADVTAWVGDRSYACTLYGGSQAVAPSADDATLYIGNDEGDHDTPMSGSLFAFLIIERELTAAEHKELHAFLTEVYSQRYSQLTEAGHLCDYVFHIGGYPYGVGTSDRCGYALDANLTARRDLYGWAEAYRGLVAPGAAYFPADEAPTFDTLRTPGDQRFKMKREQGMIGGGAWSVTLADEPSGYDPPWRNDGAIVHGLDGIHTVPSIDNDISIRYGVISEEYDYNDTAITFVQESRGDDSLSAKIEYNHDTAEELTFLWVGHECIGALDATATGDSVEFTTSGGRGLFRSRQQGVFPESDVVPYVTIADAPLGGCSGRPAYLWLLAIGDTGALLEAPILFRHGRVNKAGATSRNGETQISCDSWHSWLESSLEFPPAEKSHQLAGFFIARDGLDTEQDEYILGTGLGSPAPAHLYVQEFDSSTGAADAVKRIFLCEKNSSVFFSSIEELRSALSTELAYCYADSSDQVSGDDTGDNACVNLRHQYKVTKNGVRHVTDTAYPSRFYGPLCWILQIGYPSDSIVSKIEDGYSKCDISLWDSDDWTITKSGNGYFIPAGDDWEDGNSRRFFSAYEYSGTASDKFAGVTQGGLFEALQKWEAKYAYWPDYSTEALSPKYLPGGKFPLPLDYIYFDADSTMIFKAKADDILETTYWSDITEPDPSYCQVDGVTTSEGLVRITLGDLYTHPIDTSQPVIYGNFNQSGPAMCYNPAYMKDDKWKFRFSESSSGTLTLSGLLKSFFSSTAGDIELARDMTCEYIPDALDDSRGDFRASIDWDRLEDVVHQIDSSHVYQVNRKGSKSLAKLIGGELLFHGIEPTWEYDGTKRQYVMSFRPMNASSTTTAIWEGREFNESNILETKDSYYDANNYRYASLEAECNFYDAKSEVQIQTSSRAAKMALGSNIDSLKIEASFSKFLNFETLIKEDLDFQKTIFEHFNRNVLKAMSLAFPVVTIKVSSSMLLLSGLNLDGAITSDTLRDPWTRAIGLTDRGCRISSYSYDVQSGEMKLDVEVYPLATYAIAPAMRVATSETDGDDVIITPDAHYFSRTSDRTDLSWFDCLTWNRATESYNARSCSCTDYSVIAFEENAEASSSITTTIGSVDVSAGTAVLDGCSGSWDTDKDYIIIFAKWDDEDLQPCQRKFFCLADGDNLLIDNDGNETRGMRIG